MRHCEPLSGERRRHGCDRLAGVCCLGLRSELQIHAAGAISGCSVNDDFACATGVLHVKRAESTMSGETRPNVRSSPIF
jgi:hypothetical protein